MGRMIWLGLAVGLAIAAPSGLAFAQPAPAPTPPDSPEPSSPSATEEGAAPDAERAAQAERAAIRKLGYEGVSRYQQGDYAAAVEALERAYAALKVPSLGLWSARALEKVGRLVEASARYDEVTRLPTPADRPEVHEKAKQDAAAAGEMLRPRIPTIQVTLEGADPTTTAVELDGHGIASALWATTLPVDPGRHVVQARDGEQLVRREVELAEGERRMVTLTLVPNPAEVPPPPAPAPTMSPAPPPFYTPSTPRMPPSPAEEPAMGTQRILGWTTLGVGGAALLTGGVLGIVTLARYRSLDCPDDTCPPDRADDAEAINATRIPTTVLLVAGGLVAAGGGILLLTAPDAPTRVGLGPGSLVVARRF